MNRMSNATHIQPDAGADRSDDAAVLAIVIERFLIGVASDFLDLIRERRPHAAATATIDLWIEDLTDDPETALQHDSLIEALVAIDRATDGLRRDAGAASSDPTLIDQTDPLFCGRGDVFGLRLASRAALQARLIVQAAHPGADAFRIVTAAVTFDEREIDRLQGLIDGGIDAIRAWADEQEF